jgi:Rps23 Pro-64 3,4-dihydroxylase Tpa1-like proline 4-hydroxylase
VNNYHRQWQDNTFRGDKLIWLNDESERRVLGDAGRQLIARIERTRNELNAGCNFDSHKTQTQLACYPGNGARYVRHLDAARDSPNAQRRLTLIVYFNPEWCEAHGGCLRVFKQTDHVDIAPKHNRAVLFQSRTIEHEVLASHHLRFAFTTWFY